MKKLKNTAAALTAAVTSAVISVAANAEGGLAASKAVTGTKALLNDISNILLVVAPLVGTACIVYFAVRHGAAEEMDQKKWKQRMIVAAVSVVAALRGSRRGCRRLVRVFLPFSRVNSRQEALLAVSRQ